MARSAPTRLEGAKLAPFHREPVADPGDREAEEELRDHDVGEEVGREPSPWDHFRRGRGCNDPLGPLTATSTAVGRVDMDYHPDNHLDVDLLGALLAEGHVGRAADRADKLPRVGLMHPLLVREVVVVTAAVARRAGLLAPLALLSCRLGGLGALAYLRAALAIWALCSAVAGVVLRPLGARPEDLLGQLDDLRERGLELCRKPVSLDRHALQLGEKSCLGRRQLVALGQHLAQLGPQDAVLGLEQRVPLAVLAAGRAKHTTVTITSGPACPAPSPQPVISASMTTLIERSPLPDQRDLRMCTK